MKQTTLLATAFIVFSVGAAPAAMAQSNSANESGASSAEASKAGNHLKQDNHRQQAAQIADRDRSAPPIVLLRDWNYDRIYGEGWSARNLMDNARVYGPKGEEMGSVHNLIIGRDGTLLGIVAEVGGFLNIADTHVFVPWDQVRVGEGMKRVTLPVTEENIESYSTSADGYLQKSETGTRRIVKEELSSGPRLWKASEILEDDAILNGSIAYGTVDDLIFTSDAKLHAVVVKSYASYRGGYRAFPYYGYAYGWAPWYPAYHLGYDRNDVVNLQVLDYDKVKNRPSQGTGASKEDRMNTTTGSATTDPDQRSATGRKR